MRLDLIIVDLPGIRTQRSNPIPARYRKDCAMRYRSTPAAPHHPPCLPADALTRIDRTRPDRADRPARHPQTTAALPSMPDDHSPPEPPLPIPNRTVKRQHADDSTEFPCESRSSSGTLHPNAQPPTVGRCALGRAWPLPGRIPPAREYNGFGIRTQHCVDVIGFAARKLPSPDHAKRDMPRARPFVTVSQCLNQKQE